MSHFRPDSLQLFWKLSGYVTNTTQSHAERMTLGPPIKYGRKIFRKTNISNLLIHTRTCAYQGVRNVSFSENFAHVLNGWLLWWLWDKNQGVRKLQLPIYKEIISFTPLMLGGNNCFSTWKPILPPSGIKGLRK